MRKSGSTQNCFYRQNNAKNKEKNLNNIILSILPYFYVAKFVKIRLFKIFDLFKVISLGSVGDLADQTRAKDLDSAGDIPIYSKSFNTTRPDSTNEK